MNSEQMARLRSIVEGGDRHTTSLFITEDVGITLTSNQRAFYEWMDREVAAPLREYVEASQRVDEAFKTLIEFSAPRRLSDKEVQKFLSYLVDAKVNGAAAGSGAADKDQGRLMSLLRKKLAQAVEMGEEVEVDPEHAKSVFDRAVRRLSQKLDGGEENKMIKIVRGIEKYTQEHPKKTALAVSVVSIAAGALLFPGAGAVVGAFLRAGVGVMQGKSVGQSMKDVAKGVAIGAVGGALAGGVLDNVFSHAQSATPELAVSNLGIKPEDLGITNTDIGDVGAHDVSDVGSTDSGTSQGNSWMTPDDFDDHHDHGTTGNESPGAGSEADGKSSFNPNPDGDPVQTADASGSSDAGGDEPGYESSKLAKPGSMTKFHGHPVEVPEHGAKVMDHDMSFKEAFKAARKEFGPGVAFEWHGKLFNTYLKSEI